MKQQQNVTGMLAIASGIVCVLGWVLPLYGGGVEGNLLDGGSTFIVALVLSAGVAIVAGLGAMASATSAGLAGGAALVGGLLSGVIGAMVLFIVRALGEFGGASIGPGMVACLVGGGLGVLAFVVSVRANGTGRPVVNGGYTTVAVFGSCAALATSIGLTLPPPESFGGVSDWLGFSANAGVGILLTAFLWTPAIAGVIGFVARRRWGIALATGATIPHLWIWLSTIIDRANDATFDGAQVGVDGVFRSEFHPVFGVGIVALGLTAMAGWIVAASTPEHRHEAPGLAIAPQRPLAAVPAHAPAPALPFSPPPAPPVPPVPPPPIHVTDMVTTINPTIPVGTVPVPVLVPAPVMADDADTTVPRPVRHAVPRLRFDDGRVIEVTGTVAIGREPAAHERVPADSMFVAVADPERSVSKLHLVVSIGAGQLNVTDCGSINGTAVTTGEGHAALAAWQPHPAGPGSRVEFGARWFVVEDGFEVGVNR